MEANYKKLIFLFCLVPSAVVHGSTVPDYLSCFQHTGYTFTQYEAKKHESDIRSILNEPLNDADGKLTDNRKFCYHDLRSHVDDTDSTIISDLNKTNPKESLTIVACSKNNNKVAGFINWTPALSQVIYHTVWKEDRRKKLGSALICGVLLYQKQKGFDEVRLGISSHNTMAQSFYKKIGFNIVQHVVFANNIVLPIETWNAGSRIADNIMNNKQVDIQDILLGGYDVIEKSKERGSPQGLTCLAFFEDLQKKNISIIGCSAQHSQICSTSSLTSSQEKEVQEGGLGYNPISSHRSSTVRYKDKVGWSCPHVIVKIKPDSDDNNLPSLVPSVDTVQPNQMRRSSSPISLQEKYSQQNGRG
jgi:ribosomal protein S18 acetylase RimI-like enzyme